MKTTLRERFARIHTIDLAMLLGAAAAIFLSAAYGFSADCERAEQDVFRLHILANSDSGEDQLLKYRLRDYLLNDLAYIFDSCGSADECAAAARQNSAEITESAQDFVAENGYDYNIKCEVAEMYFSTRAYEELTMPAGEYQTLRLTIGEGKGRNWWCVIFPSLCLPAAGERVTAAGLVEKAKASGEVGAAERYERLLSALPLGERDRYAWEIFTEERKDFEVKFWVYEFFKGWFE